MCQNKPAPRCSNHATKTLAQATKNFDLNPTPANNLRKAVAQHEYDLSPVGMKALKLNGESLRLSIATMIREERIRAYKASQLTALVSANEDTVPASPTPAPQPAISRDEDELFEIAENGSVEDVMTLVDSGELTPALALYLANEGDERIQDYLAGSAFGTPEALTELSRFANASIMLKIAGNPLADSVLLRDFISSGNVDLIAAARENLNSRHLPFTP